MRDLVEEAVKFIKSRVLLQPSCPYRRFNIGEAQQMLDLQPPRSRVQFSEQDWREVAEQLLDQFREIGVGPMMADKLEFALFGEAGQHLEVGPDDRPLAEEFADGTPAIGGGVDWDYENNRWNL